MKPSANMSLRRLAFSTDHTAVAKAYKMNEIDL